MPISKTKRRLRALIDRVCSGSRLTSSDVPCVSLVPRFAAEVRRGVHDGQECLEVRVRIPGSTSWSPWLTTLRASLVLRDAGFVDVAVARLTGERGVAFRA